jgi:3-isopropylmalate/(R)-2-methylmalate dehydratase small subunit
VEPFTRVEGPGAPLDLDQVDTDRIVPARFLRQPRSAGYGRFLFHDLRRAADGTAAPGFVLDRPEYRGAVVLVAGENFGCGSSREAAVWALQGAGFRAVIAPSFGDIFRENALKNGLLPVVLPAVTVAGLRDALRARPGATLAVDLAAQVVRAPDGGLHRFDVDPFPKHCLLRGLDEIALTLERLADIEAHERRRLAEAPWLA